MKKENTVTITDNFLENGEFTTLRNNITSLEFDWHHTGHDYAQYAKTETSSDNEGSNPGEFVHMAYTDHGPRGQFYPAFHPILNKLNIAILVRIRAVLYPRLPEPFSQTFHSDIPYLKEDIRAHWTVSILYINTNNGYTEFKDGTQVECIANRLVTFPADKLHRGVTQTDEQAKIIVNFNYLQKST